MPNKEKKTSIIVQVAVLFALSALLTGFLTYFSQYAAADNDVREKTETTARQIADEVKRSVEEYPGGDWMLKYWYEHSSELDIEYDTDYYSGERTREKMEELLSHQPGLQLKYMTGSEISALPDEDQKLYAEVTYSWLITRLNQIKQTYGVDYLFLVVTQEPYTEQFFLLSAAEPGAVRGTNYEEVYPLGTTVSVGASQQEAMRNALLTSNHLAEAGEYMDYYSHLYAFDDQAVLIGLTFDLTELHSRMNREVQKGMWVAVLQELGLALLCMALISYFILQPLRKVQKNIRLYKETKDSSAIHEDLEALQSQNEIGQLSRDVRELSVEIDDYLKKIESITKEKERIDTELDLAARIQAHTLPNKFPPFPEHKEFDVYALMDPAKEVGGDFYDFFLVDDDHLGLVMADVSGKGIPGALFMMVSMILIQNSAAVKPSPAKILETVNEQVCAHNPEEMFVTVWLGILELSTGKLTAANAGHEYPLLKQPGGKYELIKDRHGFVIGGMSGMKYTDYELQLSPGSALFLYTDGLPEATDVNEQLFGTERILEAINRQPDADPETVLKNMQQSAAEFVGAAEQFDDLTMMCVSYHGKPKAETAA
ncbi:MAG: serine/threonine-protein phosphatase [Erysipelotrichaceae bacterium]|nr:serine/threonine-protein phosphatase [Erysipelotrichaceae bacterium]